MCIPKWLLAPVVKFILKCFGWHFKPHTIINDITPRTIYFNLGNDGFISKEATIGAKVSEIEQSGREKDYQKEENFEGFEEYKAFFREHTNLTKIPKAKNVEHEVGIIKRCWNKFLSLLPIKTDDIHFSPITELRSSDKHNYTLPELILLFLEFTDNYFEKIGSSSDRDKTEELINKPDFFKHRSSMSEITVNLPCSARTL
ncbi:hypothetical protein [Wolbachia endosymbiont of Folsomia candida]|uniref:hypothetical protein n=1 Tax=Wolbachia endosymbiont of Folsomia candida TaxID=169402 RepID=UPI001F1AAA68|nr:hypothetical protein [Wolbachia endosymbiont of Folsomia candida]